MGDGHADVIVAVQGDNEVSIFRGARPAEPLRLFRVGSAP